MAASAIIISSDSSDESVGSPPSRVILFGDIPTVIPSTSVVGSRDYLILLLVFSLLLLMVERLLSFTHCIVWLAFPIRSDFLMDHHAGTLMLIPCSLEEQGNSTSIIITEFPIAPVTAPPGIRRWSAILIDPGRLFLLVDLTAPILTGRAHWDLRLELVSPRVCYLEERPRCSEAFVVGVLLFDLLVPPNYIGVIIRRFTKRVDMAEVGLIGTGVDMELGISDGDEVGDHVEIDHRDARDDTEEYEADASAGDTAEVGIDPMTAPLVEEEIVEPAGEDSPDSSSTRDGIVRSVEDMPVDLGDAVRDFYHHMSEVRVDRIVGIETAQGRLEADKLIASRTEREGPRCY
ncbi:hypothetical protein Tco_0026652 [Tanacetum coccineum]